ncbi:GNAT family N-acetyltransferase [Streptomyces ossamyceticus]|uniref:GNAT family N-acetyltransferase n=1 Tax=Streptomyces ossamyceticus TaxID=249581 RepID=UPI003B8A67F5
MLRDAADVVEVQVREVQAGVRQRQYVAEAARREERVTEGALAGLCDDRPAPLAPGRADRRVAEQPRPGYHLTAWAGVVPADLAETYAASRRAMDDMPMGDTDYGTVIWDVERLVAAAETIEKRGDSLHTVAAVDSSDGTIVGFSELVLPAGGEGDGQHYGTAVLPEHRGHGLASKMKAEAVLHAHSLYPGIALLTDTAEDNASMRRVNDRLGYRPTHRAVEYQLDL